MITLEYGRGDSERSRAAVISAVRSSSPRPSPQPSGRRVPAHAWSLTRSDKSIGSDSKLISNHQLDGLVGVILSIMMVGIAGDVQ